MSQEFARTSLEVVEAHDLIDAIAKGEIPEVQFEPDIMFTMNCVRSVLCWILGHDTGREFQDNLDRYKKAVKDAGYEASFIQ